MTATFPVTEEWLDGTGGRIFTRHWEPEGRPKASLVICHGVNSHGGQYIGAGEEFASRGFAVTALDLRGRGKSDGERFYIESIDEYVSDLSLAIEQARARHPDLPLYLLGHSAGGVTSTTYALDYQERIDGLICESPCAAAEDGGFLTRSGMGSATQRGPAHARRGSAGEHSGRLRSRRRTFRA